MEQIPSSEDDNCSAVQEFTPRSWSPFSLLYSQELTTGPYPEPTELSPQLDTLFI